MNTIRICQSCGLPLPADAPAGLCPQCLLKSDAPTQTPGEAASTSAKAERPAPTPGQTFGDYRILRLLGLGGMGEVYEAEHVETGRRIALKVMSHGLASEADRKRFLREGRLAASVNHPNVVYIHGSEEIAGAPVIAMELVHGGTLKDWLKRGSPIPAAKAIEAVLQIIAGLDAAQTAGVLHRDIKPANCFVDADGSVKVGDFGLSVSTLARGESLLTATGSVLGTPAYASPEQLRGEELDATSDIYSVGATLYHLLTGRTPFRATDFVKLITEVLDKQPEAPNAVRQDVPAELSRIVMRCLAKDRRTRFQTYGQLREALLPFRATESVPASPARRFLAGLLDDLLAYGPSLLYIVYWSLDPLDSLIRERTPLAALLWLPFFLWYLLYYAIAEGRWGAGIGKTICGLRVIGPDRHAPGLLRAMLRTVVYMAPVTLPSFIVMALVPLAEMRAALARDDVAITDWLWLPLFLLLFVTMRRRNGYAAVHDLASGTRVIVRPRTELRPRSEETVLAEGGTVTPPKKLGPYELQTSLWKTAEEELILAFDPALRRRIWIHLRAENAGPVSAVRRDLNRPARLRWLNAGQWDNRVWNAYEASDGVPLLTLAQEPQSWRAVRFWLLDLAEEISTGLTDPPTAPCLALERIWIAANGRASILDFCCPGLPQAGAVTTPISLNGVEDMQRFLDLVANTALQRPSGGTARENGAALVPLHAQSFLSTLARHAFEQAEFIVGNLHSLISKPARITRAWRAASLTLAPAIILGFSLLLVGMISFERIRWERRWAALYPGKASLRTAAQVYTESIKQYRKGEITDKEVESNRIYLVNRFGPVLADDAFWRDQELTGVFTESERTQLRKAVREDTAPSPEVAQEAERSVTPRIREQERIERAGMGWIVIGGLVCGAAAFSLLEFMGWLFFGQSLILRLFGIAVVDRQGQSVTRLRLLWRWLIVWVPIGIIGALVAGFAAFALAARATLIFQLGPDSDRVIAILPWVLTTSAGAIWLGIMAYAISRPQQGLVDRLAGTKLVPN